MKTRRGFTLLELMVAVAIVASALTVLLQVQARSIQLAQQARNMTVATQLARGKLLDCEHEMTKRGFSEADFQQDGNFDDEGYSTFRWECHGYRPILPLPDPASLASGGLDMRNSPLAGLAGGAGAADNPMMGMAMGMIGPVLTQIGEVVKNSVRELTVIIRWPEGQIEETLQVTTHLVDLSGVNQIAQGMGSLPSIPGLGGALGGGGGADGAAGRPGGGGGMPGGPGRPPPLPIPGGGR